MPVGDDPLGGAFSNAPQTQYNYGRLLTARAHSVDAVLYWNVPNGLQATVTGFENPMECIYDRGASCWVANSGGNISV